MDIVERVKAIKVWKSGDQRAPHKPLLLLYVLGQYLNGHSRLVSFREVDAPLKKLLQDFGPPREAHHSELPFWHLTSDGFWDLANFEIPTKRIGSTSVKRKNLLDHDAQGGFKSEFYEQVGDPEVAAQIISVILAQNFPDSIHEDILCAVGIDPGLLSLKRKRDPKFREEILRAYRYECAICGYSSRIADVLVGVEAAHIKWHQAGGPDIHPNGVALCSLHHKAFDRGMITIANDYRILVSEKAHGTAVFDHMISAFHGQNLRIPLRPSYSPRRMYIEWHIKEVFHSPGRYLQSA